MERLDWSMFDDMDGMQELGIDEKEEEVEQAVEEEEHNFRSTEMREPIFYPTNPQHDPRQLAVCFEFVWIGCCWR